MEIEGNEKADQMAKQAAMTPTDSNMRPLKSARVTDIQKTIQIQWTKQWKQGRENAAQLRNITT